MVENHQHDRFESLAQTIYTAISQRIDFHCNVIDKDYRIVWNNRVQPEDSRVGRYCYEFYQKRIKPCNKCPDNGSGSF